MPFGIPSFNSMLCITLFGILIPVWALMIRCSPTDPSGSACPARSTAECSLRPYAPSPGGLPMRGGYDSSGLDLRPYLDQSFCTHLGETPMQRAIWALVSIPFFFSRSIQFTCSSLSFLLSGRSKSMNLPSLRLQTHTPLLPLSVRLMRFVRISTDLTHLARG